MIKTSGIKQLVTSLAPCLFLCQPVGAADLAAGKKKAEMVCQTCHGMDGRGVAAMVANIGGQQKQYLVKQLGDYRAGRRQHAQMSIIVQMLSDQDIDNVTEWYSSIVATFEIPEELADYSPAAASE
jgi:cytochrome c553